jgi:DNA-binding response OmpR family regulator
MAQLPASANTSRILIVDDKPNVRFILERALRHEGYHLDTAVNGADALLKLAAARSPYDLLPLDLQMEPINGVEVLQAARKNDPDLAVIILTAHGSLDSAIDALRLGAFDYLLKPAEPATIRRRVQEGLNLRRQAIQRRQLAAQIEGLRHILNSIDPEVPLPPTGQPRFVRAGALIIDTHHRQATLDDRRLNLTTTEYDLLLCLAAASPQPVLPRDLAAKAIGYHCPNQEARELVKWHIHQLRRKIEPDPAHPQYIKTVRHQGYLWSPNI